MDIDDWMPLYYQIIRDFDYSEQKDGLVAQILLELVTGRTTDAKVLHQIIGKVVTICGGADNLIEEIDRYGLDGTIITAGSATCALLHEGIIPDILVSDLDGPVRSEIDVNEKGCLALLHAHGDNVSLIMEWVPQFRGRIIPTCQTRPTEGLNNFGGFTDGDRAVMVARHFGAKNIRLLGFDFLHPSRKSGISPAIKMKKLEWARRLIFDLNPIGVEVWIPSLN